MGLVGDPGYGLARRRQIGTMLLATWRRHVSSSAMRYAQMMSSGGYMHSGYSQPESETTTRVLVTGAGGQIGAELVGAFSAIWGADNVIASDIKMPRTNDSQFVYLDGRSPTRVGEWQTDNSFDCLSAPLRRYGQNRRREPHHNGCPFSIAPVGGRRAEPAAGSETERSRHRARPRTGNALAAAPPSRC